MGACDFVEKPLSYNQVVDGVAAALEFRASVSQDSALLTSLERMKDRLETPPELSPPPEIGIVRTGDQPQRTISESTVLYGLGLHSGARTGPSGDQTGRPLLPSNVSRLGAVPSATL